MFKAILNHQTVDQNTIAASGTASNMMPTLLMVPLVANNARLLNFACTIVFLTLPLFRTFLLLFDCCLCLP